jgi:hypothetical protein
METESRWAVSFKQDVPHASERVWTEEAAGDLRGILLATDEHG